MSKYSDIKEGAELYNESTGETIIINNVDNYSRTVVAACVSYEEDETVDESIHLFLINELVKPFIILKKSGKGREFDLEEYQKTLRSISNQLEGKGN